MSKMRWHPETGERRVFSGDDIVPDDWLDYHPSDPDKATIEDVSVRKPAKSAKQDKSSKPVDPDPVDDDNPLTRDEIVAALTSGGVPFDKSAKARVLDGVLREALETALTANKTPFDADVSTRALLKLVQG